MAHSFTVTVSAALSEHLKNTEAEIRSNGGSFRGDVESGEFEGKSFLGPIRGEYCRISDNEIRITITDKPLMVPHGLIEAEIRQYFG